MFTILIRHTTGRKELLRRCIESIIKDGFPCDIVVSYDYEMTSEDMFDVLRGIRVANADPFENNLPFVRWIRVHKQAAPYHYNTYCNDLMAVVENYSWYMFVDDDDVVLGGALYELQKVLYSVDPQTPVIVQFKRGEKLKPSNDLMSKREILSGKIGMPCIVLNKQLEHGIEFTDAGNADYIFIKQVTEKYKPMFLAIPIVYCDRRSHGLTLTEKINTND